MKAPDDSVELRIGRLAGSDRPFLEVLDRGPGIDSTISDRIFEPFFTWRERHRPRPVHRARARAVQPRRSSSTSRAPAAAAFSASCSPIRSAGSRPEPMANPRALVVDDEPDICELLSLTLARMGVDSSAVRDLASARRELLRAARTTTSASPTCACRTATALDLIEWIQSEAPELPVAVITAHGNVEAAVRALKLGAFDFVSQAARHRGPAQARQPGAQALATAGAARDGGRRLLGDSEPMQKLRDDDQPRGAQPGARAHHGRIRHGQGAGRAPDPRVRAAQGRPVRAGQLRRDSRPS